jgi:TolB protein
MAKFRHYLILTAVIAVLTTMPFGIATQPVQGKHLSVATGRDHCLEEKVAFTSTRDHPTIGSAEIYLMNLDGTNVERITDNLVGDAFPDLRPDGKRIVFDSNRLRAEGDSILRSDLFVMKTDGSEQTFIARGSSADWSPDGKSVTFHASASGLTTPIRQDPGGPTIDSDLFIVNVGAALDEGANPTNITNTPAQIEEDPNWSPDGEKIVYTRFDAGDDPNRPSSQEIFVVNADGSGTPEQLTLNSSDERAPAWSPDGTRIVFMCRYGGTDFEICIMNADGSGLVQVTDNLVQELSIRWTVGGDQLVFNRGVPPAPGGNQIFSINVDGTGETQLTNTLAGTNIAAAPGLARVKDAGGECDAGFRSSVAAVRPTLIDSPWKVAGALVTRRRQ